MPDGDDALTPDASDLTPPTPRKPVREADSEAEILAEERIYASLVDHPGWTQFERDLRQEILDLRTMKDAAIQGKSIEEVGKMYLVAREAGDRLERMIDRIGVIAAAVKEQAE